MLLLPSRIKRRDVKKHPLEVHPLSPNNMLETTVLKCFPFILARALR